MVNIIANPEWKDVRVLEREEVALGGVDGNMNEQATSLSSQNNLTRLYAGLPFDQNFTDNVGGFPIGGSASLVNGNKVKSTLPNNTNNPNVNMTGWVLVNEASQIFDESGKTQQEVNDVAFFNPTTGYKIGGIGGTFRGYSGGVQFVTDTAHAPFGTTGISQPDTYGVRIEHSNSFGKVGTLLCAPDETFAAQGVIAGGSVGLTYSDIKVVAPLYFTIKGDGTITKVSPLFEGSVSVIAGNNPAGGILRVSHPLKSVSAHQAIAVNRSFADNVAKPMNIGVFNNDGGTYTQINTYGTPEDNSVWVKYNATTSQFEAVQGINKASFSFSFNASSGGLTITHQPVKTGAYLTIPILTPFNTNKRYSVGAISSTTTVIQCYDPAGNVVKTLSEADWSFFFSIKPALQEPTLIAIPATSEFTVFVGNCYVPSANLQKVPSGNIWFYGGMNK